jgi:protein phosphatase
MLNQTQPLSPDMAAPPQQGTFAPGTDIAGYRVLELRSEQPHMRVYRAQAPADLCLQCGTRATESNARFCEVCGAELLPRDVLLLEPLGDTPTSGPWLALALPPDPEQALLPPLTPLEHNGTRLLAVEETIPGWQSLAELLITHGSTPNQPAALEDNDALVVARQLVAVIHYLHRNNVALGQLGLAQLLIGSGGRFRLRDVNDLQPLTPETQRSDLERLRQTLDEITQQPRTTQRLDTAQPPAQAPETLQDVLALARADKLADAAAWVAALHAVAQHQRAVTPLHTTVAAQSHVGKVRELNEDSLLTLHLAIDMAGQPLNVGIYAVADGMGGHAAGEIASSMALQRMARMAAPTLIDLLGDSTAGVTFDALHTAALEAAQAANEAVWNESQQRGNDMGTTLTFALVVGDRCVVGNVGDSRTYLFRDEQLQRISKDHSLVQRLVDVGQITPDDVYTHPHRNAILRSLGEGVSVEVDLFDVRLQAGDALLCCSDGLWEMIRDDRLAALLASTDAQAAVAQAIDEANRNGGEDNIAAVLVQFAPPPTAPVADAQTIATMQGGANA